VRYGKYLIAGGSAIAIIMKTKNNVYRYKILLTNTQPEMRGLWDGFFWRPAPVLKVSCFRPESSAHYPQTSCKLLYNRKGIFGIFRVDDQYVQCLCSGFQSDVWKDSCVEFFVEPPGDRGYFNFEFNCGGALAASYVTDPARADGRLAGFLPLTADDDRHIQRLSSLQAIIDPEITEKITWYLEFSIPFFILEKYIGDLGKIRGQTWRANFFKCGNQTSHPHWASWTPLKARNFHDPASFGNIEFE
jgi:hypothetical protein